MFPLHCLPMTQLLTGVGQMAFETIGFHAALILNRLRNERLKTAVNEKQNDGGNDEDRKEEKARAELALVNQRLRDLAEFERRARGEDRLRRKRK